VEFKENKRLLSTQGINVCPEQAKPLTLEEERELVFEFTPDQYRRLIPSMVNGKLDLLADWRVKR
jgi:hypothetical protein